MTDVLIVLFSIWTILLIGSLIPIRMTVGFCYHHKDDYLNIQCDLLWGLLTYRLSLPAIKWAEQYPMWIETVLKSGKETEASRPKAEMRSLSRLLRIYIKIIEDYRRFIDTLSYYVRCEKFVWETCIGSSDPAVTGIMTGAIWTIKGLVFSVLRNRLKFIKPPTINVTPNFKTLITKGSFLCIFTLNGGNIIIAILKTMIAKAREK